MAASLTTVAEVVNAALVRIGYRLRVGSLYDGSEAAKAALIIYGQTRDVLLRSNAWGFAEQIVAGALTGQAAPFPWAYEYTYPANCLKLRNLFNASYNADPNNPLPNQSSIGNNSSTGNKVIWCNLAGATFVITAQITNPAMWEALFTETLIVELGKRLAMDLNREDFLKIVEADEKQVITVAQGTVG